MYCQHCGIYNKNDEGKCHICDLELAGSENLQDEKVYIDMTQIPYPIVIHDLLKNANPILAIISTPIITLIYFFKKILGHPFFITILNSRFPKFQEIQIESFRRLNQKSFKKFSSFFANQGFEQLLDYEDVSRAHGVLERKLVNPKRNMFGTILISKATGKVLSVSFFAFTEKETCIIVNNEPIEIPIKYPKNVILQNFPYKSANEIYTVFQNTIKKLNEAPRRLSIKHVFIIDCKLRAFLIQQGVKQGHIHINIKKSASKAATVCYHHPNNIAVRTCAECNTPLCEACYISYDEKFWCKKCLPEKKKTTPIKEISFKGDNFGFAGFGVRSFALLIDLIVISMLAFAVLKGSEYGIKMLMLREAYSAVPVMVCQFFVVSFTIYYFFAPVYKYGQTAGQKMCRLYVVDSHGNLPDKVSAIVRFAYHLISLLFIFPLVGYIFILFRKTKQGVHDQLANTYVITKNPRTKALISWAFLVIVLGYGISSVTPFLKNFIFRSFEANITLQQQWVRKSDSQDYWAMSYLGRRGLKCILHSQTSIYALDIRTGELVWEVGNIPNEGIIPAYGNNYDLLIVIANHKDKKSLLMNIDPETGAVFWKTELEVNGAQATFDNQSVVVNSKKALCEYDMNGKMLFRETIPNGHVISRVVLNGNILVEKYLESNPYETTLELERSMVYLERQTGKKLWEKKDTKWHTGYTVGEGIQCFYSDEGNAVMFDLLSQKPLWESKQDLGFVQAHYRSPPDSSDNIDFYLYTNNKAVNGIDGSVLFSYPPSTYLKMVSNEYLVLSHTAKSNQLIIANKLTGEIEAIKNVNLIDDKKSNTSYDCFVLAEDKSKVCLAANIISTSLRNPKTASALLFFEKPSLEMTRIRLGENINIRNIFLLPDENLVFIPAFQGVGTYVLPV